MFFIIFAHSPYIYIAFEFPSKDHYIWMTIYRSLVMTHSILTQ